MNREYLHVNSSRWKTQMALLWDRGPAPTPVSPTTLINSSVHFGGRTRAAPGCNFFSSVGDPPSDPNTHPFLLLHSCVCKIAASNRSVVKLRSKKKMQKQHTHLAPSDHEIHKTPPRPPPPPRASYLEHTQIAIAEASAAQLLSWPSHHCRLNCQ